MKNRIAFITMLLLSLSTGTAIACGDSLYRVGKGLEYRNYSVPLPGRLLVYGGTAEAQQLAMALTDSGHEVLVVATEEDLANELRDGGFEIVIATYADRELIRAIGHSATSFLPVALDRDERQLAAQEFEYVLEADDEIKRFLKTIHKTLKSRA